MAPTGQSVRLPLMTSVIVLQTGVAFGAVATGGRYGLRDPRLLLGGAALGAATGVLAHITTHREDSVIPSNMVEELKSSRDG